MDMGYRTKDCSPHPIDVMAIHGHVPDVAGTGGSPMTLRIGLLLFAVFVLVSTQAASAEARLGEPECGCCSMLPDVPEFEAKARQQGSMDQRRFPDTV